MVGPSDDAYNDLHGKPHALTVEEIQEVVAAFAAAAKRAVACGYDFIEIHAAHGYLLHEFLSPLSNHRTDSYGGSFENRIRLVKEVACAVRKAIPEGMPLFVRISASDLVEGSSWDVPEAAKLCTELVQNCGVDMMDISSAGLSDQQVIPSNWDFQEQMSHTIKKETGVVCSAVGGICDAASASYVVDELGVDIVEIGKAALFHFFNPREIALQMGVGSGRGGLCIASHDALQSGNRLGAPCSSQLQKLVCLLQNRRKGRGKEVDVFAGFGSHLLLAARNALRVGFYA